MLKILQARQKVNHELPDVQDGFRKGKGTGDPTSTGSSKEQESSRKTFISALLTMPKSLTVWTWPASWESCMQVRKQQLELYIGQQTGSK